jgi:tetratricopeptide (TPR) repeat protein
MDERISSLNQKGIQSALGGDTRNAEKCFLNALSISLYSLESVCNLLKLYYMQKQYSDGIQLFFRIKTITSLADIPPQALTMFASCFAAESNLEMAISLLHMVHISHPRDVDTACKLSNLLIQVGKLSKAKEVLESINDSKVNDPNILTQLAIVQSELGNYIDAELLYKKLIKCYGQYFLSYYNYALFLSMLGREDESLDLLDVCLKLVPNAPEALAEIKRIKLKSDSILADIYRFIESKEWIEAVQLLTHAKTIIDPIFYWSIIFELPIDYARLVEQVDKLCPNPQVQSFNLFDSNENSNSHLSILEKYIINQESLISDRAGKPTRFGKQSHEILKGSTNESILILKSKLKRILSAYISSQPLLKLINKKQISKNELSGWAVVLDCGGYQKRHIHPEAIVSGVIYIKLSEDTKDTNLVDGNLILHTHQKKIMITPQEGLAVIFPSYLAHETVPIKSDHERICIAFNLI